jgi:hypothetical protein
MRTMLNQYINYYNPELYYVIEGDLLSIESDVEIKNEFDVDVVCIGTQTIKESDLFRRIKDNANKHGCWTEKYTDIELYKLFKDIINKSIKDREIAKENKLIYLDNSYGEEILKNYVNNIR